MVIIGLTGKICSGKTEFANMCKEKYGFTILKFETDITIEDIKNI
jgi:dephospho-CoA kinase